MNGVLIQYIIILWLFQCWFRTRSKTEANTRRQHIIFKLTIKKENVRNSSIQFKFNIYTSCSRKPMNNDAADEWASAL